MSRANAARVIACAVSWRHVTAARAITTSGSRSCPPGAEQKNGTQQKDRRMMLQQIPGIPNAHLSTKPGQVSLGRLALIYVKAAWSQ